MAERAYGYSLFCDDVRDEVSGKVTYVGVYRSQMYIHGEFPAMLSKLAIVVTLFELMDDAAAAPPKLTLQIHLPGEAGDAPFFEQELDLLEIRRKLEEIRRPPPADADGDRFAMANYNCLFSPVMIKQPGMIRVRAIYGDKTLRLGSLEVLPVPPAPSS